MAPVVDDKGAADVIENASGVDIAVDPGWGWDDDEARAWA